MLKPPTRLAIEPLPGLVLLLSLIALPAVALAPAAPAVDAGELLAAAIAYHDAEGVWERGSFRIVLEESRPDGGSRETAIVIDNAAGHFMMRRQAGDDLIEAMVRDDDCQVRLNGSDDIPPERAEELRLGCDALQRTRDYYVYLYGLPMKLRDPGTRIDPEVEKTTFQGRDVLGIRVTYDPDVGSDTWYFYFDTDPKALVGYRFYHDESANDGEYITLEGEATGAGLRLPKTRSWYTHQGDRHLGTDTIVSIERFD